MTGVTSEQQAVGWREAEALQARSAKLKLYAMVRRTLDGPRLPVALPEHLRWLVGLEEKGHVFLAGPIAPHDGPSKASSMILFRTATKEEAAVLAADDPLVKAGILAFELLEWTASEGSIPLTISLSGSSARIG